MDADEVEALLRGGEDLCVSYRTLATGEVDLRGREPLWWERAAGLAAVLGLGLVLGCAPHDPLEEANVLVMEDGSIDAPAIRMAPEGTKPGEERGTETIVVPSPPAVAGGARAVPAGALPPTPVLPGVSEVPSFLPTPARRRSPPPPDSEVKHLLSGGLSVVELVVGARDRGESWRDDWPEYDAEAAAEARARRKARRAGRKYRRSLRRGARRAER